jgi:GNAT superfamily N-acetyltransferase
MIVEVNESNIGQAASIHSESWMESHKSFCAADFVAQHTAGHQEAYLRKEMMAGKKVYMLVDGVPAGIVSVWENMIENLYVLPKKQHMGYGTKLLMFAMHECRGVPVLWILENNQKAYALYSKYGFVKTGKQNRLSDTLSEIEMRYGGR